MEHGRFASGVIGRAHPQRLDPIDFQLAIPGENRPNHLSGRRDDDIAKTSVIFNKLDKVLTLFGNWWVCGLLKVDKESQPYKDKDHPRPSDTSWPWGRQ